MVNFDFETGRRYLSEGDIVEAIRCFLASLELDPQFAQTYCELFTAYERAWAETGDPEILDQMRKVVIAGLKRERTDEQTRFLEDALDRTDELIISVQREEEEAEGVRSLEGPRLPMVDDDGRSGSDG